MSRTTVSGEELPGCRKRQAGNRLSSLVYLLGTVGFETKSSRAKFVTSFVETSATTELVCPQSLSKRVAPQTGQFERQERAGRCRIRVGGPAFMKFGPQ